MKWVKAIVVIVVTTGAAIYVIRKVSFLNSIVFGA